MYAFSAQNLLGLWSQKFSKHINWFKSSINLLTRLLAVSKKLSVEILNRYYSPPKKKNNFHSTAPNTQTTKLNELKACLINFYVIIARVTYISKYINDKDMCTNVARWLIIYNPRWRNIQLFRVFNPKSWHHHQRIALPTT